MTAIEFRLLPGLPRLAWLAVVEDSHRHVWAFHGLDVEVGKDFLVEGVWDAPFEGRRFPESANFFGSGFRLDSEGIVFCPSRALVDRLFVLQLATGYLVSNSLPLALNAVGGQVLEGHTYRAESFTILKGIRDYEPAIPVALGTPGSLTQQFYSPFRIGGRGVSTIGIESDPPLETFPAYHGHLTAVVEALVSNASDRARRQPLDLRVALSKGYDSPAVAALLSQFAEPVAYTSRHSNSLIPAWIDPLARDDDGSEIASRLGLPVRVADPHERVHEQFFFAASTADPELVFSSLAGDCSKNDRPSVLFSGYHGDKVWSLDPGTEYLSDDLKRGDTSGLPLSEVRLVAGWIAAPVPFIGARSINSLVAISRSTAMERWRVGGDYDRPIPRRIAEDRGVPREAFGWRKRAVVQTVVTPSGHRERDDFAEWLSTAMGIRLSIHHQLARASLFRWAMLRGVAKVLDPLGVAVEEPDRWSLLPQGDPTSLLFRWAVGRLAASDGPYPPELRRQVSDLLGIRVP